MTNKHITNNSINDYMRCIYLGENRPPTSQEDPEKRLLINLAAQHHLNVPIIATPTTLTKQSSLDLIEDTLYTNVNIAESNVSSQNCMLQKKGNHIVLYEASCSYNPQREDIDKLALTYLICKRLWISVANAYIFTIDKSPKKRTKPYHFIKKVTMYSRIKRVAKKIDTNVISKIITNNVEKKFGTHCFKPKVCDLFQSCWKDHNQWDIFKLSQFSLEKKIEYFNQGIVSFKQIKAHIPNLTENQKRQIQVESTQIPYIDKAQLNQFFSMLTPTYHCLDIEVLQLAIPLLKPLKTFQKLPILYSIHTFDHQNNKITHQDNLFIPTTDFRYEFASQIISFLSSKNKIVVFDATLEKQILTELAILYPTLKSKLNKIKDSILDLAPLFIRHHIILAGMKGKASLKAILPCIKSSLSYSKLSVQSGLDVVKAYKHIAYNPHLDISKTSKKLRDYCALDTLAIIEIIEYLKQLNSTN